MLHDPSAQCRDSLTFSNHARGPWEGVPREDGVSTDDRLWNILQKTGPFQDPSPGLEGAVQTLRATGVQTRS